MSESTTPPEIWNNILEGNVEKNDPFWKEYLDKAAVFDVRMVDEWNKTVDVLLVYVGLLISVLTSFITNNSTTQLKRNPADITNDLLVAIYNQTVAQSNNISITPVNPMSFFSLSQNDYDAAVTQTALLYVSLSLSIVVSFIALAAKLWLVSYSRQAFSVGSPYDRAMKRQEAYNGVLVWNMGGVINMLPVILLIALYMFAYFVYTMVSAAQQIIGDIIEIILNLGLLFLVEASFKAACIPGCPFRSPFSDVIRYYWEKVVLFAVNEIVQQRLPLIQRRRTPIRMWIKWIILIIAGAIIMVLLFNVHATIFPLYFLYCGIPILAIVHFLGDIKPVHKPQKYKISSSVAWMCLFASMIMLISFSNPNLSFLDENDQGYVVISLFLIGLAGTIFTWLIFVKMSKSMADTGEIDAIAWILITTPPQDPVTFFKKAGQMTGDNSVGCHYRSRLLESLMSLLIPLITSESNYPVNEDPHLKNLEIYIACLARLSNFEDYKGTWQCWWEDAMQHPKLEPLIPTLVVLARPQLDFSVRLRSAATKVLKNYKLNREGQPLERHTTTVLENVATDPRDETIPMLNDPMSNFQEQGHSELYRLEELATHVEPAHSSEEVEEVRREIGDEDIEEVRRDVGDVDIERVRRDVGDEEIEEVRHDVGDEEIEEVRRDVGDEEIEEVRRDVGDEEIEEVRRDVGDE